MHYATCDTTAQGVSAERGGAEVLRIVHDLDAGGSADLGRFGEPSDVVMVRNAQRGQTPFLRLQNEFFGGELVLVNRRSNGTPFWALSASNRDPLGARGFGWRDHQG